MKVLQRHSKRIRSDRNSLNIQFLFGGLNFQNSSDGPNNAQEFRKRKNPKKFKAELHQSFAPKTGQTRKISAACPHGKAEASSKPCRTIDKRLVDLEEWFVYSKLKQC